MSFRRRPCAARGRRPLARGEPDDAPRIAHGAAARRADRAAARADAEEAFGDYQLALEALKDRIVEVRDTFSATLADPEAYERQFERAAAKRWPDIEAV